MATSLSISPIAAEFQMSLLMLESMKADDDGIPEVHDSVANYSIFPYNALDNFGKQCTVLFLKFSNLKVPKFEKM